MRSEQQFPIDCLKQGSELLNEVLSPAGFQLGPIKSGKGSGGYSASCAFTTEGKTLEIHFRQSLGLVTYHVGDHSLRHEDYMKFLGMHRDAKYPGFSDDPIDAFLALSSDMRKFCKNFVDGDGREVQLFARELAQNPNRFDGLP